MPNQHIRELVLSFDLQGESANNESSVWLKKYYNGTLDSDTEPQHIVGRNGEQRIKFDVNERVYTYSTRIEFREPNALLSLKDITIMGEAEPNDKNQDAASK